MIVLHIPVGGAEPTLVSIPRDSWVTIPGYGKGKINAAYGDAYTTAKDHHRSELQAESAGIIETIKTIEALTGLHIDHYAQVSLIGFYRISNAIGGVSVCLKSAQNASTDSDAYGRGYSGIDLPKGVSVIKGKQALAFVRQRHGLPHGDLDRIKRQQYFLASALHKVTSAGILLNPFKLHHMLTAVGSSLLTDPALNLLDLARQMQSVANGKIHHVTIPNEGPQMIYPDRVPTSVVVVDRVAMPGFIRRLQGKSDDPALATATPAAPGSVAVDVLNGTDIVGLAGRNGRQLRKLGFHVDTIDSTTSPQKATQIEYPARHQSGAKALLALVPGAKTVLTATVKRVTLVLGSDGRQVRRLAGSGTAQGSSVASPPTSPPTSPPDRPRRLPARRGRRTPAVAPRTASAASTDAIRDLPALDAPGRASRRKIVFGTRARAEPGGSPPPGRPAPQVASAGAQTELRRRRRPGLRCRAASVAARTRPPAPAAVAPPAHGRRAPGRPQLGTADLAGRLQPDLCRVAGARGHVLVEVPPVQGQPRAGRHRGRPGQLRGRGRRTARTILVVGNDDRNDMTDAEVKALHTGRSGGSLNTDTMMIIHLPSDGTRATLGLLAARLLCADPSLTERPSSTRPTRTATWPHTAAAARSGKPARGCSCAPSSSSPVFTSTTTRRSTCSASTGSATRSAACRFTCARPCTRRSRRHPAAQGPQRHQGHAGAGVRAAALRLPNGLGDLDRVKRQQYFLTAAFRKVASAGTLLNPFKLQDLLQAVQRITVRRHRARPARARSRAGEPDRQQHHRQDDPDRGIRQHRRR